MKRRALMAGLLLLGVGVYLSHVTDQVLNAFVRDALKRLRQRKGLVVVVGAIDNHFTSIRINDIAIGDPAWLVMDHLDVAISFDSFKDFLRPRDVIIGHMMIKLHDKPHHQLTVKLPADLPAELPAELRALLEVFRSKNAEDAPMPTENQAGHGLSSLQPRVVKVESAQVVLADDEKIQWSAEHVQVDLDLEEHTGYFKVGHLFAFDRLDEDFLELEVDHPSKSTFHLKMAQRPNFRGLPLWHIDCVNEQLAWDVNCQVDAMRLPTPLLKLFQPHLGTVFVPGYRGRIQVSAGAKTGSRIFDRLWSASFDGVVTDIFVEHKALAIDAVGPFNLHLSGRAGWIPADHHLLIKKTVVGLMQPDGDHSKKQTAELPFTVEGDLTLQRDQGQHRQVSGDIHLDLDQVNCQQAYEAIPPSFIPELAGITLEGRASLHVVGRFVSGLKGVSLSQSSFGCAVHSIPDAFTAEYLNGPFVIERELGGSLARSGNNLEGESERESADPPGATIKIPVDPNRPEFVALQDIPALVRSSFVSSEDTGFYHHKGIELAAILTAFERNAEEGRAAFGGSTITMQTVKNLYLSRDKTISRKLQEMFLAWHIEQTITKDRILEIYLNMVEFGPNLFGVGPASRKFFDKTPQELTLKESLYLASLLPAPIPRYRYYCQGRLTDNYKRLVGQLLDRMLALGRISTSQYNTAVSEPIAFSSKNLDATCDQYSKKWTTPPTDESDRG